MHAYLDLSWFPLQKGGYEEIRISKLMVLDHHAHYTLNPPDGEHFGVPQKTRNEQTK